MIERCVVCCLEFVEREKADRFSQLCGNCMQMAERETAQQEPTSDREPRRYAGGAGADIQEKFRTGVSRQDKPETPDERGLDIVQIFLYSPVNGGRYEGDKLPKRKRLWP